MAMHRVTIHVTIQAILAAIAIHGVAHGCRSEASSFMKAFGFSLVIYLANCRMVLRR